jgi:hypothetical protein
MIGGVRSQIFPQLLSLSRPITPAQSLYAYAHCVVGDLKGSNFVTASLSRCDQPLGISGRLRSPRTTGHDNAPLKSARRSRFFSGFC